MDNSSTLGNCNAEAVVPAPKSLQGTEQPHTMQMKSLPGDNTCLHLCSEKS